MDHEKVLVILGSSRKNSDTLAAVKKLCPFKEYELIELYDYKIEHYDYDAAKMCQDDFIPIAKKLTKAEILIFATPVYWYSMSGQMKVFLDRLTELLYEYKPLGKALKGKKTYLIASGGRPDFPEGFEVPFKLTSEYFDMEYVGSFYQYVNNKK
jgi:multimeric flavodoxin WrbA